MANLVKKSQTVLPFRIKNLNFVNAKQIDPMAENVEEKEGPGLNAVIDYRDVEVERANRVVLEHVTFSVGKGEFCYLVGKVGGGKSSLLKTMYADVPVYEGEAHVLDYDLRSLRRRDIPLLRRGCGIVFQDFQLLQGRSAYANLDFVLRATGWKSRGDRDERIEEVLTEVDMLSKSYKMPHELSGGEQQRIVIARALLNKPELILADEPTGNLDPHTGYQIVSLLHKLAGEGHTVMMATHNMQLVEEFPARVLRCADKHLL